MATYLQSLLGEDELNTVKRDARGMSLLQAGLAGLMASGPSLTPTSAGQALGAAGLSGLSSYQNAMQEAERQGLQNVKFQDMLQARQSDEAFKAALPNVFKDGKIDYPALQQLALVYPKEVGEIVNAYKSAQPPQAPAVNLQFDAKTGTVFNPRTGEVTYTQGGQQDNFAIPEGSTPEQVAEIYRREAQRFSTTDPKMAKEYFDLANKVNPQEAVKPPTEGQLTAGGFYDRMVNSNSIIDPLEDAGEYPMFGAATAGAIPFVGGIAKRVVMSPETQQYQQAADDWIRSKLRKESGAVIGADEMRQEYETYFPQPGDSKQVIEQKARARKVATDAMRKSAGTAIVQPKTNRFRYNPVTQQLEAK